MAVALLLTVGRAVVARSWATVHIAGVEQWLRRAL
jgi:hypothetical protein